MKIKLGNGLPAINALSVLLIVIVVLFPSSVLRVVLGFPFILFFPGYALTVALYPRKTGISFVERIALSLGLSICAVAVIGLILNYIPWGIGLDSMLSSMAAFIFLMWAAAWFRGRELPGAEKLNLDFSISRPSWTGSRWDKALTVTLVVAILAAAGTAGLLFLKPKTGQKFTEFYILPAESEKRDFPREMVAGREEKVLLGISNNEYETTRYRVVIKLDGETIGEIGPLILAHGESREQETGFSSNRAGYNQKVEFILYRDDITEPYLEPLRLFVNVK